MTSLPDPDQPEHLYDAAIVGAGPAGSACAIHLARAGLSVALVDRCAFPRDKPCAEYLSPAAEPLLAELGVLDALAATNPSRLLGFRVYAPGGRVFQGDFAATRGADGRSLYTSGLCVPRSGLDAVLVDVARASRAEVYERWALARLERAADGTHLLLPADPTRMSPLRARLLVAADGVHSTVARRLGLHEPTPARMRKVALVAHMRGIAGLGSHGEMHVYGRRYVGLARLEPPDVGDLCNVAMVVDEARDGASLKGRAQDFLLASLATFPAIRGRLDRVRIVRPTLTTSRLCVRARRLSTHGVLLVGDAAGYYDPFTGEGIFRALHSAQLAASVAADALARSDLSAGALASYDRAFHAAERGKLTVEAIVQLAVQHPGLMDHIAARLARRKPMADTLVAVTGDYLPPSAVLRPGYLARLVV
jgi:flavin-dependent dehydrogenase